MSLIPAALCSRFLCPQASIAELRPFEAFSFCLGEYQPEFFLQVFPFWFYVGEVFGIGINE